LKSIANKYLLLAILINLVMFAQVYAQESGYLNATDGAKVYYQIWKAPFTEVNLIIIHGYGEYSGRYNELSKFLSERGISTYAIDLRGHGRSDGKRGDIGSLETVMSDINKLKKLIDNNKKVYILGHSMGSLIALNYSITYPENVDGIVISSPIIDICMELFSRDICLEGFIPILNPILRIITPIAGSIDLGSLGSIVGLGNVENLTPEDMVIFTHDPEMQKSHLEDPLLHGSLTINTADEILKAMQFINKNINKIIKPTLILYGDNDTIIDTNAVVSFYNEIPTSDKTIIEYPGYAHNIFEEIGRVEGPFTDLYKWMLLHK
jgi:alpha-beta hydrolase superfamily lysophospholipase